MNKRLALGIGLIIVIAIIASFIMRDKPTNSEVKGESTTPPPAAEVTQPKTEQASLKSLLGMAGAKKCTFTTTQNDLQAQGTVYVNSGKMRGDFSTSSNNQTMMSHMMVDGQTSYMWVDGQTTGYKMSLDKLTAPDSAAKERGIDPNKNFDFSCSDWAVDASQFTTPTNIQFTDVSAMMDKAPTGGMPTTNTMAACDTLQEPAKSQCQAAMKGK